MPRLTPCPSCHTHLFVDEPACPHCGVVLPRNGSGSGSGRVAAVVVGLTLGGCIIPQPAYGIPDPTEGFGSTGTAGTAGTEGETDSSGSATETGTSGSDGTSTGMADGASSSTTDGMSTGTDETAGSDGTAGSSGPEPAYGVATSG